MKRQGICILTVLLLSLGMVPGALAKGKTPPGCSTETFIPETEAVFPLEQWSVSSAYGIREDPFTGQEDFHWGIDFAAPPGCRIYAVGEGIVASAGYDSEYGNYVRVHLGGGVETLYGHLQFVYVRAGQWVAAGQPLGTVGQTGKATGPHLHLELIYNRIRRDPAPWLKV